MDLPAVSAVDAVRDGQIMAFLGVHIILVMGVTREDDFSIESLNFFDYRRQYSDSLFGTKGAVDKIVLHVSYDQNVYHCCSSLTGSLITSLVLVIEMTSSIPSSFTICSGLPEPELSH